MSKSEEEYNNWILIFQELINGVKDTVFAIDYVKLICVSSKASIGFYKTSVKN